MPAPNYGYNPGSSYGGSRPWWMSGGGFPGGGFPGGGGYPGGGGGYPIGGGGYPGGGGGYPGGGFPGGYPMPNPPIPSLPEDKNSFTVLVNSLGDLNKDGKMTKDEFNAVKGYIEQQRDFVGTMSRAYGVYGGMNPYGFLQARLNRDANLLNKLAPLFDSKDALSINSDEINKLFGGDNLLSSTDVTNYIQNGGGTTGTITNFSIANNIKDILGTMEWDPNSATGLADFKAYLDAGLVKPENPADDKQAAQFLKDNADVIFNYLKSQGKKVNLENIKTLIASKDTADGTDVLNQKDIDKIKSELAVATKFSIADVNLGFNNASGIPVEFASKDDLKTHVDTILAQRLANASSDQKPNIQRQIDAMKFLYDNYGKLDQNGNGKVSINEVQDIAKKVATDKPDANSVDYLSQADLDSVSTVSIPTTADQINNALSGLDAVTSSTQLRSFELALFDVNNPLRADLAKDGVLTADDLKTAKTRIDTAIATITAANQVGSPTYLKLLNMRDSIKLFVNPDGSINQANFDLGKLASRSGDGITFDGIKRLAAAGQNITNQDGDGKLDAADLSALSKAFKTTFSANAAEQGPIDWVNIRATATSGANAPLGLGGTSLVSLLGPNHPFLANGNFDITKIDAAPNNGLKFDNIYAGFQKATGGNLDTALTEESLNTWLKANKPAAGAPQADKDAYDALVAMSAMWKYLPTTGTPATINFNSIVSVMGSDGNGATLTAKELIFQALQEKRFPTGP